jgi:hypothetical protein
MQKRGRKPSIGVVLACTRGNSGSHTHQSHSIAVSSPYEQVVFAVRCRFIETAQPLKCLAAHAQSLIAKRQPEVVGTQPCSARIEPSQRGAVILICNIEIMDRVGMRLNRRGQRAQRIWANAAVGM